MDPAELQVLHFKRRRRTAARGSLLGKAGSRSSRACDTLFLAVGHRIDRPESPRQLTLGDLVVAIETQSA